MTIPLLRAAKPRSIAGPRLPVSVLSGVFFLLAAPAHAELSVRVSRTVTGQYESVGITVTDPIGGLDAKPGPVAVTMADGSDRRQTLYLEPTGRPGEWAGRFTPLRTGRYTGTAMLERGAERELGLVPLVRVRPSRRPGFLSLDRIQNRTLRFTGGRTLFPIGVRLDPADLRAGINWRAELARLGAAGVNFLVLPVEWPEALSPEDRARTLAVLDALLVAAETSGRFSVAMRLGAPSDVASGGADGYEAQLQQWVRRWSYSPALAAWYVAGATDEAAPELRARFVRAVRTHDAYRHVVAAPCEDSAGAGADLSIARWDWTRPDSRRCFFEVPDEMAAAPSLPGETSWQSLVHGGVGLPTQPYRPGDASSAALLGRLSRLRSVARAVPFHAAPVALRDVLPVDSPGSFSRYGWVTLGWLAPEGLAEIELPQLPRGRYRTRLWDAGADRPVSTAYTWSDGRGARITLPARTDGVFLEMIRQEEPVRRTRVARAVRVARPVAKKPAVWKPAPKKAAAKKPARKVVVKRPARPVRQTAAQLRAAKRAAALAAAKRKRAVAVARKQAAARRSKPARRVVRTRRKAVVRKAAPRASKARKPVKRGRRR